MVLRDASASKNMFPNIGNGKGMNKINSKIREREGSEKIQFHNWERESEAFIPGNGREQEFLLSPDIELFDVNLIMMPIAR